jgi:hypothetical protein
MATLGLSATHVVEYTAGADSLDGLAALICAHLRLDGSVAYMQSAIRFAISFEPAWPPTGHPELVDFHQLLRHRGIVRLLNGIIWPVTSHSLASNTAEELVTDCLSLLAIELCNPCGYLWLPQALRSGLLGCIAQIAKMRGSCAHISNLRQLPENTQSTTVYHSVVQNLAGYLPDASLSVPADSPIYSQWMKFFSLARERLDTANGFDAPERMVCDNLEVNHFTPDILHPC